MLARRLSPIVALAFAAAPRVLTAQAKEYLYVGNTLSGDLSIIAIPEHKVVGTIPTSVVGNSPDDVISSRNVDVGGTPNHLALPRDERMLYVPLYDKGELVVVDTKTHAIVKRIVVGTSA